MYVNNTNITFNIDWENCCIYQAKLNFKRKVTVLYFENFFKRMQMDSSTLLSLGFDIYIRNFYKIPLQIYENIRVKRQVTCQQYNGNSWNSLKRSWSNSRGVQTTHRELPFAMLPAFPCSLLHDVLYPLLPNLILLCIQN